jgi:hypothetical protein
MKIFNAALHRMVPSRFRKLLLAMYRFVKVLGSYRAEHHIDHFRDIHKMALDIAWLKRNQETSVMNCYASSQQPIETKEFYRSKEFKVYSQNGEDGLLLFLYSHIGIASKTYINLGCGGRSSNTANLSINFGWKGLDIDADEKTLLQSRKVLTDQNVPLCKLPIQRKNWVTKNNINQIINLHEMNEEIDLLSIDIDGNDYWIWKALEIVRPRIVLIEYNASFGPTRSITVPYSDDFDRWKFHESGWYHGASLVALNKLANEKKYSLFCCDSNGINAFFIRDDLVKSFHPLKPDHAYYEHALRPGNHIDQFEHINTCEYVEI